MDVKIVKGVSFDAIRMFMAFAVIPAQSEETIGVGRAICENNGKVEWTKDALTYRSLILEVHFQELKV